MDDKKRKLMEKIEDLNQQRSLAHHDLKNLEARKQDIPEKKYQRLKAKYKKKEDKIRQRIRELEEEVHALT
ncbi:MAG: hypothetical protein ACP5EK_05565 [Thermoplasmatota archaeon]